MDKNWTTVKGRKMNKKTYKSKELYWIENELTILSNIETILDIELSNIVKYEADDPIKNLVKDEHIKYSIIEN